MSIDNIGSSIKEYRQKKNWTQKQLADAIGVSYQQISQYERGERNPKIETLQKIVDALDCNLMDIIGNDGWKWYLSRSFPDSFRREKLVDAFDRLNDKGQEVAVDRVEELGQIPAYQKNLQKPTDTPSDE